MTLLHQVQIYIWFNSFCVRQKQSFFILKPGNSASDLHFIQNSAGLKKRVTRHTIMVFIRLIFGGAHARLLLPSPGGEAPQPLTGRWWGGGFIWINSYSGYVLYSLKSNKGDTVTLFSWKVQGYWKNFISHLQMAEECDANRWDRKAQAEAVSRLKQVLVASTHPSSPTIYSGVQQNRKYNR